MPSFGAHWMIAIRITRSSLTAGGQ
jgi:hypothetical protein